MNIIDKIFGRKEPPEERCIPEIARDIPPGEGWITGDLMKVEGKEFKKNTRAYIAALKERSVEEEWRIYIVSYINGEKYTSARMALLGYAQSLEDVIRFIDRHNKDEPPKGVRSSFISGQEGNWHEFIAKAGLYRDEKGELKVLSGAALKDEVMFTRGQMGEMYNGQAAKKTAEKKTFVSTWDDYYREVVGKNTALPNSLAGGAASREMLEAVAKFERDMADPNVAAADKKKCVRQIQGFSCQSPGIDASYAYQHNVVVLTALLRAGGNLYQEFSTASAVAPETLELLSEIGKGIKNFAAGMWWTAAFQENLADLITRGADPYTGKPLPLEEFITQRRKKPAQEKTGP